MMTARRVCCSRGVIDVSGMSARSCALWVICIPVLVFVLGACGGGGSGGASGGTEGVGGNGTGGDDPDSGPNVDVQGVLDTLNVNTDPEPRIDPDGRELPDDYAPFGSRVTANKFSEIVLLGVPVDDSRISTSGNELVVTNLVPGSNNSVSWELLHEEAVANTPWSDRLAKRASAAADFDNDGLEELAVVYQLEGDVELVIMQDAASDFQISAAMDVDNTTVEEVFLAAGDFDGDNDLDLIVGFITPLGDAELKYMVNEEGDFRFTGVSWPVSQQTYGLAQLVIRAGNFDQDAPLELLVSVNAGSITSSNNGISPSESWINIYDDANTTFDPLIENRRLDLDDGNGTTRAALVNADIGDLDGDNVDEIVLGGLNQIGGLSEGYSNFQYMIETLDDAQQEFVVMASGFQDILTNDDGNYQPSSSGASQSLNHVPVVAADVDGDGAKEFLVGQYLFNSLSTSPSELSYYDDDNAATDDEGVARIPATHWFGAPRSGMQFNFRWSNYAIAAADVTLDGRENIVIYTQRSVSIIGDNQELQVWGHDQVEGWRQVASYVNERSVNLAYKPQLHLPDIELDDGTAMLAFSTGSHELVFTEPVILAAIAAAPCATDLGQDLTQSCRSAYGTALSDTTIKTDGTSLTARASVGFGADDPVTNNSIEITAALERRARSWTRDSYTTTRTLLYETGAIEDSVVFTSIPIDVYTYTVLSHPDPTLVGEEVFVRLPRDSQTIMVTREKFNDAVLEDSLRVDSSVFEHVQGQPSTYPTPAVRNALLSQFIGILGTPASVGEGLGQTISTISSFEETSEGSSYEDTKSVSVRATGGLFGGFVIGELSVGFGTDSAIETSHGTESIYQGSVGNITSEAFDAGESYDWGIFTYIYDPGSNRQSFEVINYWVE